MIHIRIIDPDFQGMDKLPRDTKNWSYLEPLPNEIFVNITLLLLLTPEEAPHSWANFEFEHPVPMAPIPSFAETDLRPQRQDKQLKLGNNIHN